MISLKKNVEENEPKESGLIDLKLSNSDDHYDSMYEYVMNKCFFFFPIKLCNGMKNIY